ncbi:hypothetical protein [Bradyrhizobium sp. B120]|uniref:hypothetical protein n=1 Tax=Bradyrhizobium sp. B120 TaxID=3410088 RepID=UPI003B982889
MNVNEDLSSLTDLIDPDLSVAEMQRAQICFSHEPSLVIMMRSPVRVRRAGFKGLCASRRSFACYHAYRYANELS